MKNYTIFGICLCGCEQSRTDRVRATGSDEALIMAGRRNRARGIQVVAVVEGWHENMLTKTVNIPAKS